MCSFFSFTAICSLAHAHYAHLLNFECYSIRIGWINFFRSFFFIVVVFIVLSSLFLIFVCTCMPVFTHDECNGHLAGSNINKKQNKTKQNYYQYSKMCSMNTSTLISHLIYWIWYEMQASKHTKIHFLFYFRFGLCRCCDWPTKQIDLIDFLCFNIAKYSHILHLKCWPQMITADQPWTNSAFISK